MAYSCASAARTSASVRRSPSTVADQLLESRDGDPGPESVRRQRPGHSRPLRGARGAGRRRCRAWSMTRSAAAAASAYRFAVPCTAKLRRAASASPASVVLALEDRGRPIDGGPARRRSSPPRAGEDASPGPPPSSASAPSAAAPIALAPRPSLLLRISLGLLELARAPSAPRRDRGGSRRCARSAAGRVAAARSQQVGCGVHVAPAAARRPAAASFSAARPPIDRACSSSSAKLGQESIRLLEVIAEDLFVLL